MVTVREDQDTSPPVPKWQPFLKSDLIGEYDKKRDVLFICAGSAKDQPAVSVDIDGEYWLRVDPETFEIVGIEIEEFKSLFLEKHPEAARIWHQAERGIRARPERKQPILSLIVEFLQDLFRSTPRQLSFA